MQPGQSQVIAGRQSSREASQVLKSGWIAWQMDAVDGDDDLVVTTASAVGLMFLIQGGVDSQWECSGQRRSSYLPAGIVEFCPADGREHRYRYRWERGTTALTVQIPSTQWALLVAEDGTPATVYQRRFSIHDPVLGHCLQTLFLRGTDRPDSIDEDAIARVLMIRLMELQGVATPRWVADTDSLPRATIRLIRDFVDANLCRAIDLASLAHIANLSRGHFARTFRRTIGMSPGDYVRVRRVRAAFERVCNGDGKLSEVADGVGFSSQGHMTSAFVRTTGITPGFARRRGLQPRPVPSSV